MPLEVASDWLSSLLRMGGRGAGGGAGGAGMVRGRLQAEWGGWVGGGGEGGAA